MRARLYGPRMPTTSSRWRSGRTRSTTGERNSSGSIGWSASTTNLRAALRYFVEAGDTGRGTRLAAALRRFWWIRGHTDEARTWFTTLVELARRGQGRCAGAQTTLARALTGAALFAYQENTSAALGLLAGEAEGL